MRDAKAQAIVLLNDEFAECWTASDPASTPSRAATGIDWFDVNGDRVGKPSRASACRALHHRRLGQCGGVCDRFDTRLDDGALGSFHGSQRVTQFQQWAAPPPLARVTQAERPS